jgi:mono/diheme cytochrome c family protein
MPMKRALTACLSLAVLTVQAAEPARLRHLSYTQTQAEQGAMLYAGQCAMCHGAALAGSFETPPLTGRFVGNWAGAPLSELSAYIRRAMPQMAPGTLSSEQAAALVAFLLRENGVKSGGTPLPYRPEDLKHLAFPATVLDAHPADGPARLPQ